MNINEYDSTEFRTGKQGSGVLDEYRRLIESDLRRLEQCQATAPYGMPVYRERDDAVRRHIRDALITLRQVLDEYHPTGSFARPSIVASAG
ncbi:hypothetical protein AB0912_28635 [Streptomyces sp. NPDC007084]|uniref:hypothetical protein n=1 Tax=Streptomyces sp. NPDC007084 TaxID=3154313 RepID=UPI003451E516